MMYYDFICYYFYMLLEIIFLTEIFFYQCNSLEIINIGYWISVDEILVYIFKRKKGPPIRHAWYLQHSAYLYGTSQTAFTMPQPNTIK